ncbi:hypothetical protein KHP62_12655 [Rhodobacteraceae bacterium NNCM2]|nr:hypothetical protein [Coraliihabitans acroporae]
MRIARSTPGAAVAFLVLAFLAACDPGQVTGPSFGYAPPAPNQDLDNQRVVAASYDATWTGLIDHVSRTNFTIDQFEKQSGLLTMSFGEADISRYVDCGTWTKDGVTTPYAARTDQGLGLNGRINVRVQERGPEATDVRVDALYILRNKQGDVWKFTTNERATVNLDGTQASGTVPTRTCQSTREAERLILNGVEAIASTR